MSGLSDRALRQLRISLYGKTAETKRDRALGRIERKAARSRRQYLDPGDVYAHVSRFQGIDVGILFDRERRTRNVSGARRLAVLIFRKEGQTFDWIAEHLDMTHSGALWLEQSATAIERETANVLYRELKERRAPTR